MALKINGRSAADHRSTPSSTGGPCSSEYWRWALVSISVSIVLPILINTGTAGATTSASGAVTSALGPGLFTGGAPGNDHPVPGAEGPAAS